VAALLRVPILPGALVAALVAAVGPPGIVLAVAVAVGAAALVAASRDRPRRLLWGATAAIAAASAARALVPAFPLEPPSLEAARAALAAPLRALVPEPESALVLAITLGERTAIPPELREAFAASGTSHLLAISGYNMTLVALAVGLLARGRVSPAPAAALAVAAVFLYSALVGLGPSVVRAALMAGVAAFGVALGRPARSANALCVAVAAMLLADPGGLADVGFLLSVAATAGLIVMQAPLAARLSSLPRALREGLATTLAATAPTLPIVAAIFGRVSLVSPLANLLAVPLFPPLMVTGLAAAALGSLSLDAARPLALAAYALALALRTVAETAAALPGASLALPTGAVTGLAVATAVVAAAVAVARARPPSLLAPAVRLPGRRATAAGAVVALAVAIPLVILGARAPELRVRILDVGQGDAFLIESRGRFALVDGGPDPARLLAQLGASLAPWERRIDVVVLTHAHADHGTGLLALFDRYEIGLALEPRGLNAVPLSDLWRDRAARAGVTRRAVGAGARVRVGGAVLQVLAPNDDPRVDTPSLVLRLEQGPFSMLFTADATDQALADLLLDAPALAARVYVPPHHGAATPHAPALVAAVRPEAAVLSVGATNRYGHPTPETLAALGAVPTYRTDRDGTVEITLDGSRLVVRTRANGLPPPRGRSVPRAPPAR